VGDSAGAKEPHRLRRLVVTAIVAAAVGAGIGIAAGYQLPQNSSPVFKASGPPHRAPFGVVTRVDADSVTISSFGHDTKVETDAGTIVNEARDATLADIDKGETIVVSGNADGRGTVRAKEIVVLPTRWVFLLR